MFVKKTNKAAFREDNHPPAGGHSFCPCRKDAKTRPGRGKIPNLFPLPGAPPLIQTDKRECPFGYPRANGKCGKKLTGGEASEKANCRTGNLPTRTVILSEAKNPYPWYFKKKRQIVTDPSTLLALRSG